MAREESERMARIHHEGLLVSHCSKILHHEAVLCPVLEHCSVSSIGDQFVRMLCNAVVQIVLNHGHDCCSLLRPCWVFVNRTCVHLVVRTQAVHIDAAVFLEFLCELRCEFCVMLSREVAECILYGQHLLLCAEDILALRGVADICVIRFRLWKHCRNTCQYIFVKFCHILFDMSS